jgi:hypothetical protein
MMTQDTRVHDVQDLHADDAYLYLIVDGHSYRVRWENCSPRLERARLSERQHMLLSSSGYGIHWPEIDEDLAITPLLDHAETPSARGVAAE